MDIKLTTDHDLDLTSRDLQLTDDDNGESVRQRLLIRLLSFKGELFSNTDYGVPYFQTIFQKNVSKGVVDGIIQQQIRSVQGVAKIISYTSTMNNASRDYTASFKVSTTSGAIVEVTL